MTTKQKAAIWLAVLLIITASLYPPWLPERYVLDEGQRRQLDGVVSQLEQQRESDKTIKSAVSAFKQQFGRPETYHWLFDTSLGNATSQKLDLSRLFVEWMVAGVIGAGLYLAWPNITKTQVKKSGGNLVIVLVRGLEILLIVFVGASVVNTVTGIITNSFPNLLAWDKEPASWVFLRLIVAVAICWLWVFFTLSYRGFARLRQRWHHRVGQ